MPQTAVTEFRCQAPHYGRQARRCHTVASMWLVFWWCSGLRCCAVLGLEGKGWVSARLWPCKFLLVTVRCAQT